MPEADLPSTTSEAIGVAGPAPVGATADATPGAAVPAGSPASATIEALRTAALQTIAAARAVLDLAEQAVNDPDLATQATAAVRAAAQRVLATGAKVTAGLTRSGPPDDDDELEHIELS